MEIFLFLQYSFEINRLRLKIIQDGYLFKKKILYV